MVTIVLIFACLLGLSSSQFMPDEQAIKQSVDASFNRLDNNPKDGKITLAELYALNELEDVNKDGCVTESEFQGFIHVPLPQFATQMFNMNDHNKDGCLTNSDKLQELILMDTSGDSVVTLAEYEPFVVNMVSKILMDIFSTGGLFGK